MNKPSIYFFCPAYNDEGNIEKVVSGAAKVLEETSGDYLIAIVEDGSPDKTGEIADRLTKEYSKLKVIHHPVNMGYGKALQTGFENPERENYDLIVYTDGDGQFDITELKKVLPLIENNDVVIGYRISRAEGWRRKFQSWVYNFLTRMISGLKFRDFNCSFKIFRREVLEHIDIEFPSVFIDAELVIKAALAGYKIAETGVTHYSRATGEGSGAKWSLISDTMKSMLEFRKKYRKKELKYRIKALREKEKYD
jgi:glycosyltransferase involved in cell wall biosynthesis